MNKKSFAIIGSPVDHSLSPFLHNYWFKKYKIEAEYNMLEIEEADIKSVLGKIKSREISGLNVTLPFKKKIIPYFILMRFVIKRLKHPFFLETVNFSGRLIGLCVGWHLELIMRWLGRI